MILLVGNSNKVLDNEYGELIDSFDTVVRFNNFVLKGYEKFIGTKVDYLWLSRPFLELANNWDAKYLTYSRYISSAPRSKRNQFEEVQLYPKKTVAGHFYSSGVSVAWHFLNRGHDVYIHGICDGGNGHYWDKSFKVLGKHKLNLELKIFEKWDKVKRLRDCAN